MSHRIAFRLVGLLFLISTVGCAMTQRGKPDARSSGRESQLSLARLSERHGKMDFAKQVYENTLRKDPQNQTALHRIAVIEASRGRLAEAKKHFSQAMKHGEPSDELLSDYGYALYLMDDLKEAEHVLRQVIKRDPQHKTARNNLALVLGEQGRFDESMEQFRMVVDEAEALANLAYVKSQMGEFKEAENTYHRALAMNHDLRPAAEALLQLNRIDAEMKPAVKSPAPPSIDHIASGEFNRERAPETGTDNVRSGRRHTQSAGDDRVARHRSNRIDSRVQPASYDNRDAPEPGNRRSPNVRSRRSESVRHPAQRPTAPSPPATTNLGSIGDFEYDSFAAEAEPPAFFPSAIDAKHASSVPRQSPRASKIEAVERLAPPPRFESSFVDEMNREFSRGTVPRSMLFD